MQKITVRFIELVDSLTIIRILSPNSRIFRFSFFSLGSSIANKFSVLSFIQEAALRGQSLSSQQF